MLTESVCECGGVGQPPRLPNHQQVRQEGADLGGTWVVEWALLLGLLLRRRLLLLLRLLLLHQALLLDSAHLWR